MDNFTLGVILGGEKYFAAISRKLGGVENNSV